MGAPAQFFMTDRDYAILRGIAMARPTGERGYFDLLRHKLVYADIVAPDIIDPDIVTMNSLVRYRQGDGRWLDHKLVIGANREVIGETVSLRTMQGLALLGMREDQVFAYDGPADALSVAAVLFQPEADAEIRSYGQARMWQGR